MSAVMTDALDGASVNSPVAKYVSRFADHKIGFGKQLRSEWLKMWTLRSTWWMMGATVVLMAGLSLLFAGVMDLVVNEMRGMGGGGAGAADISEMSVGIVIVVLGYQLAQLTVAVFATLTITNEYSSGMIRATLSATPRRLRTLLAKLVVVTLTTIVVTLVGLTLAWAVTYPLMSSNHTLVDFSQWDQVRSLLGTVLYLVMIAWMALGIGTLMRGSAGAISTVMGLILVAPMILGMIVMFAPNIGWVGQIYRFLPSEAGQQIVMQLDGMMGPDSGAMSVEMLSPWVGFAVLAAYAVAALAAGAWSMKRRDA
ncbi:MAG: hypothetical protein FWG11_02570 [Promicromonosporaceae bacterium]|nr:hypothetical protein [Promicromonosporaceae bacterium]